jgi:hypothetical protein
LCCAENRRASTDGRKKRGNKSDSAFTRQENVVWAAHAVKKRRVEQTIIGRGLVSLAKVTKYKLINSPFHCFVKSYVGS